MGTRLKKDFKLRVQDYQKRVYEMCTQVKKDLDERKYK